MMAMPCYPGIEFNPRDDHLLTFYLPKKIAGGRDALAIPNYLICDFNVYSTEPWNLPRDTFRYPNNKNDMHFFSCRQPTSANSKRVQRTAGHGFWYGARGDEKVYYESQHVGYKTVLTFKYTKGGKEINSNWIMHEFHLKPPENSNKFASMVICRIHKNKTKEDREGGADADSGVAAIIEQEEQRTATHVDERPLKRKRVEASSSLPSLSSSLPAFLPCKEAETFNQLISTMHEKRHAVFDREEEGDERQVIEMLLKEHEAMTNHSEAAAESGAPTSVCEQEATYVQDSLRKRKWVEGCSNFFDTENSSTANTEASSWPSSSSPYLSSSWLCAPALDSYEPSSSLINVLPPTSQDDGTWEDLDIDVSTMSYLDELLECFTDS